MMDEEKPAYYSILTADVRYVKSLSAQEKILYSEITALADLKGYCYASNNYFAHIYGVDSSTIKRWLRNLKDEGFIAVEIEYKTDTKEIEKRRIIPITTPSSKMSLGRCKNEPTPRCKNEPENTTSYSYSSNTHKEESISLQEYIGQTDSDFEQFWSVYPKKVAKAEARKAFAKKVRHEDMTKLLATIDKYKRTKQWSDKQYIPHPTTFLNQERWNDEVVSDRKSWDEMSDFEKEMFMDLAKEIDPNDLK